MTAPPDAPLGKLTITLPLPLLREVHDAARRTGRTAQVLVAQVLHAAVSPESPPPVLPPPTPPGAAGAVIGAYLPEDLRSAVMLKSLSTGQDLTGWLRTTLTQAAQAGECPGRSHLHRGRPGRTASVWVPAEVHARVAALAEHGHRSISAWVRDVLWASVGGQ